MNRDDIQVGDVASGVAVICTITFDAGIVLRVLNDALIRGGPTARVAGYVPRGIRRQLHIPFFEYRIQCSHCLVTLHFASLENPTIAIIEPGKKKKQKKRERNEKTRENFKIVHYL